MKIVITSGFPDAQLRGEASIAKLPLLVKPYRRVELARVMREVLDR